MDREFKSKIDSYFGLGDKKLNARKSKGASDAVTKQLILAGLQRSGVIFTRDDTTVIDASETIENRWGSDGKPNATTVNIRRVLSQLIDGLRKTGASYTVLQKGEVDDDNNN